jgi:1,4-alpha-glucan branching enzyme
MGGELAQWNEWNHAESLPWNLLDYDEHRGVQSLVRDLNRIYRDEPALWEADTGPAGFEWLDCMNADENIVAFQRVAPSSGRRIVCICNFSPVPRPSYRLALPGPGGYAEILNTDSAFYGGGNTGNGGGVAAEPVPWHGRGWSAPVRLPPLSAVWFRLQS